MILSWEKPPRQMSTEDWKTISADSAPPGVYSPNMNEPDRLKWKAKLLGKRSGVKQVEIRKSTTNGTQILMIVSLDGFRSKKRVDGKEFPGKNVRISQNGPSVFNWLEWAEMNQAIEEAIAVLKAERI